MVWVQNMSTQDEALTGVAEAMKSLGLPENADESLLQASAVAVVQVGEGAPPEANSRVAAEPSGNLEEGAQPLDHDFDPDPGDSTR